MDDSTTVQVNIYKTDVLIDDADDPTIIDMLPTGNPLNISVIDNDKDKLKQIKGKQAAIEVYTSNTINIATFTGGPDNLFYVEILTGEPEYLFKGFLATADIIQAFQPNPNVLLLTATDGLGALKDIPLTINGENPEGYKRLAEVIANCLNKTGMDLDIYVVNNLRHGSGISTEALCNFSNSSSTIFFPSSFHTEFYPGQQIQVTATGANNGTIFTVVANNGGANIQVTPAPVHQSGATNVAFTDLSSGKHLYDGVYIDSLTFEAEIGECEDCYSVLEKILREDCFLTQYRGNWWIVRVDEFEDGNVYVSKFNSDGSFNSHLSPTLYDKSVGVGEDLFFVNANQDVERERPVNFAKLTYRYEYPKEIPCNSDFSRGDYIADISATEKKYQLDCWRNTIVNITTGAESPETSATTYIYKKFNGDYEIERYVVFTGGAYSLSNYHAIVSKPIPVNNRDKFNVGFSWRIKTAGVLRYRSCLIKLLGDSGAVYYWKVAGTGNPLRPFEYKWTTSSTSDYVSAEIEVDDTFIDYQNDWQSFTLELGAVPESGNVFIYIYNKTVSLSTFDTNLSDFSFEYLPYINGAYQEYKGQYQKVTRPETGYLAKRDEDVSISDSPKKLIKGALFIGQRGSIIYTDNTDFFDDHFNVPSNRVSTFYPGRVIKLEGTTSNNIFIQVVNSVYNSGNNTTDVYCIETFTPEDDQNTNFYAASFNLTSVFYPYHKYPTGTGDVKPYGEHQIRSVFNQWLRANWMIKGSVLGMDNDWPDLIHKYSLTDSSVMTNDKYFILTSFNQDWKRGEMDANFIEVYDLDGKRYDDDREFKYVTE